MMIRIFLYILLVEKDLFPLFTTSDVIAWGLILSISIFNERRRFFDDNPSVSSVSSVYSVSMIAVFCVTFTCKLVNEIKPIFSEKTILYASLIFAFGTFLVGFVFIKLCSPVIIKEKQP
jgi:hypothetical protein